MDVERHEQEQEDMSRSLEIEDSIGDAVQRPGQIPQIAAKPSRAPVDSKQKDSRFADQPLAQTCDAVAAEIQETGQAVVNIANTIAAESDALAELLHKHGAAIGARIQEFMSMSERVKGKMRAAHDDMLGTAGVGPSLTPQAKHGHRE